MKHPPMVTDKKQHQKMKRLAKTARYIKRFKKVEAKIKVKRRQLDKLIDTAMALATKALAK